MGRSDDHNLFFVLLTQPAAGLGLGGWLAQLGRLGCGSAWLIFLIFWLDSIGPLESPNIQMNVASPTVQFWTVEEATGRAQARAQKKIPN